MEEIYEKYAKIVYKYLISLTGNNDIAQELTQETVYSAIKHIDNFRYDSSIKNWLCKIAKNKFINYYNKKKNYKETSLEDLSEILWLDKSFEEKYEDRDCLIQIYKKLHKLDESSKEVVLLRIKGEMSYKEIASIMDKTEEWARITFYRAKMKLREELENE